MIDKALMVIMFMYAATFGILIGQYIFADVFGITLRNHEGVEITSELVSLIRVNDLNTLTNAIISSDFSNIIQNVTTVAAVTWELLQIITGTYVFQILLLLGVPLIAVAPMIILYALLVGRLIIGYVRGL